MTLAGSDELLILLAFGFLLVAVLRWSFGTGRTERKLDRARDYGLLREVATAPSARAAEFVRERLRRNGIRATTVPVEGSGGVRVLVFPADAAAAADLLLAENLSETEDE